MKIPSLIFFFFFLTKVFVSSDSKENRIFEKWLVSNEEKRFIQWAATNLVRAQIL